MGNHDYAGSVEAQEAFTGDARWHARMNYTLTVPEADLTIVFIDSPLSRRQLWTKASRGWSAEELARREASQWPIARKQSESDFIIDNSGMLFETVQQLERVVREVISRKGSLASSLLPPGEGLGVRVVQ